MNKLPLLPIGILCILSCSDMTNVRGELERLEESLESRPDSVLTALDNMDRSRLKTRQDQADYALLLSSALDKNYIDICSDSIIRPATDWYSRRGSADKRLKTFYYRGLVSENAGDLEGAMEWFKRGEEYSGSDISIAARLYKHKASLYYEMFYYDDALINAGISANYFLQCGEYVNYLYRILDIVDTHIALNDMDEAEKSLGKMSDYWDHADNRLKADYFWTRINIAIKLKDNQKLEKAIEECNSELKNPDEVQYIRVKLAEAYLTLGDYEKAGNALSGYTPDYSDEDEVNSYLLIKSEYLEKTGDFKQALEYFREYNYAESEKTVRSLTSDVKFIEERYEKKIDNIKAKNREHTMFLTFFVLMAVCVIIIRYIKIALNNVKSELSETELNYKQVDEERKALISIMNSSTVLDKESLSLINKRLLLLDQVLLGHLSQDPSVSKKARNSIDSLVSNKDSFINETSRVFCASHPEFAKYLKDHDLTEWEIGYCCLFMMGMYSKDLEPYFSVRTSNLVSASIRKKLNIPSNGQKLKSFLIEQYESFKN